MTLTIVLTIVTTSFLKRKICATRPLPVFRPCNAIILPPPLTTSTESELTTPKYVIMRTKARKTQVTSPLTDTTPKALLRRLNSLSIPHPALVTPRTLVPIVRRLSFLPRWTLRLESTFRRLKRPCVKVTEATTQPPLHPDRPMVKSIFGEPSELIMKLVLGPTTLNRFLPRGVQTPTKLLYPVLTFKARVRWTFMALHRRPVVRSEKSLLLQRTLPTRDNLEKPLLMFPTSITVRWLLQTVSVRLLMALAVILIRGSTCTRANTGLLVGVAPFLTGIIPNRGLKSAKSAVIRLRKLPNMSNMTMSVTAVIVILTIETESTIPTMRASPPEKRHS